MDNVTSREHALIRAAWFVARYRPVLAKKREHFEATVRSLADLYVAEEEIALGATGRADVTLAIAAEDRILGLDATQRVREGAPFL